MPGDTEMMYAGDAMIRTEQLGIDFEGRMILDSVDISVWPGETVAVLGRNGCGKTLLLKSIAGLFPFSRGSVFLGKKPDGSESSTAYVFQKGGLFDYLNVFDNTAFGLRRRGFSEDEVRDRVMSSLKRVGLSGNENKYPSELSGGMQKRAGLARAVCMSPDIILYDDPSAGLDPVLSDSIADLVLGIAETSGTTSLLVTHDMSFAEKTADRIMLLYAGKAVYSGSCGEFFSGGNVYAQQFIEGRIDGPMDYM